MASPTHVERLERLLLRRGVGALEADRNRCADCGRTPLTGEQVHRLRGRRQRTRLRALPPAAPRAPGRERDRAPRRARPDRAPAPPAPPRSRAAPPRPRRRPEAARLIDCARRGPRHRLDRHLRPARAGLRLPPGHRQPPGVHRPLPGRLAPDADRLGRPRGGGALPRQGAGQPLQLGRCDLRRGRAPAPHRRGRPHRQEQPRAHARRLRAGAAPAGATRVASRWRPSRRRSRTALWRGSARARWLRRKNQRAMRRLRGRSSSARPGGARAGRA